MKEQILKQYDGMKLIYLEYENKIRDLISTLIKENKTPIHGIESRVKDRESLSKKIDKKDDKYKGLDEITDTLGLRIITYFEDDVDLIADILKKEFILDEANSTDKRNKNPDSFGYLSLHFVLRLKEPRASLPEYSRFNEINFEIQIRSILQHAWAEIEHDLGYKSKNEIPKDIRRDFSRIASLLELADKEFIRIKSFLKDYSIDTERKIKEDDLNLPIDKVTLQKFLIESELVHEIEERIAQNFHGIRYWDDDMLTNSIKRTQFFKIKTISELHELLIENKQLIIDFVDKWIDEKDENSRVTVGISIFYLAYILVGKTQDVFYGKKYVEEFFIGHNGEFLSNEILQTYKSIL